MDCHHEFYLKSVQNFSEMIEIRHWLVWGSIKTNEFATFSPYSYFKCNAFLKIFYINYFKT